MTTNVPVAPVIIPGAVIKQGANEYKIGPPFASGGFGVVFHARRTQPTGLDVVVKVPAAHILNDPTLAARFEREATILANIHHINVVRIVAFWKFSTGEMALVQELVVGAQKLSDYLKTRTNEAPSVYLQALYAMRAFHAGPNGAVHRDISPANILVDGSGYAKVIDFGLAKEDPRVGDVLTVTGHWFGTPGCMAPEQMDDAKRVDHRADLYGLGRSITAALQGRNPQHADPNALPDPWRSLIMRLCQHDADDRPASAEVAIAEALQAFSAAGIVITNFDLHLEQMATVSPVPSGWSATCQAYLTQFADIDQTTVVLASKLSSATFAPPFDANGLFDRIEAGASIRAFDAGAMDFDDCDPLGTLYRKLYAHLDARRRLECFRRLCRTAVRWHRYAVMGDVRSTYALENTPTLKAQLLTILNAEDGPPHVIHGRGVIPGRNP